jgi:hypothetical protein
MNSRSPNLLAFTTVAAMILACSSLPVRAITASTNVLPIAQVGFTSRVKLGHMVNARTLMNSLVAGGTFRVICPGSYTGSIEGQNSRPQSVVWPPNVLSVEVPPGPLPAERELPGFNSVPGGTTLSCAYYWTASARESTYNIGSPGGGLPIGGEAYNAGDTVTFEMYQPGSSDEDNNGCIR